MLPQVFPHHCHRIRKGRLRLGVPRGLAGWQTTTPDVLMRQQGDQREQPQQSWRGTQDSQVRPLALGLDAQVGADFMERDLNGLITNDKFCLCRFGQLTLSWSRRPLRLRETDDGKAAYPPKENIPCGGPHEASVASAPATDTPPRRATPLGSSLPTPSAMEPIFSPKAGGDQ